ncbi:cellulase [Alteromonas aestuariivivens]|uniref:Endoglucanase n=1 Tax=Alteromonas aestuariivivens TaxID=1938339 RepID=A0A3D8M8X5_9ALTE|nr:glycoside hydrolase family 9 protein [Alteromonas aestuariivivens]RDV25651.1 cellulase [Alteromonas aestuariivivens]
MTLRYLGLLVAGLSLCGCSQNIQSTDNSDLVAIQLNQVGFSPELPKLAVIENYHSVDYSVVDLENGVQVLSGSVPSGTIWSPAGVPANVVDLSSITRAGKYRISVANGKAFRDFDVSGTAFATLHDAAIKAYYYNRAGSALLQEYAGIWARESGHKDEHVLVHRSAASDFRPSGTVLSAPKGWYDAGDYNKYVVNSGISTYTLMRTYLDFQPFYQNRQWNIPESGNGRADILDEIAWNLDWMHSMQDADGGVYHKLTTLQFSGAEMPAQATEARYVVQKSTAATLNFAAVFAMASRLYPEHAQAYLASAQMAWQWANRFPDTEFRNPEDVATGEYGDQTFSDEFGWAAAELYLATQDIRYLNRFLSYNLTLSTPSWFDTASLAYISLLSDGHELLSTTIYDQLSRALMEYAADAARESDSSSFAVAMQERDFVWGSNSVALNKAMLVWKAWQLSGIGQYRQVSLGLLDYILGRNPLGMSFVTGFGQISPMKIHHRPSEADGILAPVPGFVVGGPQNGHQDGCHYRSDLPAVSYLDDWCSYSTNEVTINWNAPLVYMLAAVMAGSD